MTARLLRATALFAAALFCSPSFASDAVARAWAAAVATPACGHADCPCGPDCACGPNCKCGTPEAKSAVATLAAALVAVTPAEVGVKNPWQPGTTYEDAYASRRPFVCWIGGATCIPCESKHAYVPHVHVDSLPGFTGPCCVVAYPDQDGAYWYYPDEVQSGSYDSDRLGLLLRRGLRRTAAYTTVCGPNGCATVPNGYAATGCTTCGQAGVTYTYYAADDGAVYATDGGAYQGGRRGPIRRFFGRAFGGRRGGCASCGG